MDLSAKIGSRSISRVRLVRRVAAFAFAAGLIANCDPAGPEIDDRGLDSIPSLDALDYARVQPATDWQYWELRHGFPGSGSGVEIIGSGGPVPRASLPPSVVADLDAAEPLQGFAPSCLPAYCFDYVAATDGLGVTVFSTVEGLRQFLGTVDNATEATLLVHGLGFYWLPSHPGIGYRAAANGGWEFIVLELVRTCAPVQTDRVVLRVEPTAQTAEIGREVWQREEGVCI